MKTLTFCFTVDDVGLAGYSSEEHLRKLLDFCNLEGLKTTWFTVPFDQNVDIGTRSGYISLLKRALSEGHDVGQHGLRHDRFETGIPPEMILSLPHEAPTRERLERDRDAIERELTVEKIRGRLSMGRRMLSDALDHDIIGFRAGALSSCPNLFYALNEEGYSWDSSAVLQEAGWDLIQGNVDVDPMPITRERFNNMQYPGRYPTFPVTTDYTWYLTTDRYAPGLALASHDILSCVDCDIPFVPMAHVSPIMEGEPDLGLQFYRDLLQWLRRMAENRRINLEFKTLTEAWEDQKCGKEPV